MGAPVVASGDAPPVFEPAEAVFDFMALFVESLIVVMLDFPRLFWRDARLDPLSDQGLPEPIAIVATVAGEGFRGRKCREHQTGPCVIAHLPWG